jgi:hypothetical protein
MLVFNRPVDMDLAKIKQIINLTIPGVSASQFSWTAIKINDTSYKLPITLTVSLN